MGSRTTFRLCVLVAMAFLMLVSVASPSGAAPTPKLKLHLDDGIDWCFVDDQEGDTPAGGDTVTTTLRVGNGIVGARGYERSRKTPRGFLGGTSTVLDFGTETDDGSLSVDLPFRFPFFGIRYGQASVTTNGWVGFGQAAWDYYPDCEPEPPEVTAQFYRGVMPYRRDLHLDAHDMTDEPGEVRMVVSGDGNAVAFQWRDMAHCCVDPPDRNFQVVLFRDGRIRYDYPGSNPPTADADNVGIVALSGGNGLQTYDELFRDILGVPNPSFLFSPHPMRVGRSRQGGVTTNLPPGSSFEGASSGCALTDPPGPSDAGHVRCLVPSLMRGEQRSFDVEWSVPTPPPDMTLRGTYRAGGITREDTDQLLLD